MRITLQPYSGGEFTAQDDAEHIDRVIDMFKGLLVQTGYHPNTVDDSFNTEQRWFPDEDQQPNLTDVQHSIKQVLNSWQDTQLNMSSDSARTLLALAIAEGLQNDGKFDC